MSKIWFWEALLAGDFEYLLKWMEYNWTLSVYISVAYVVFIFLGKSYMKTRPAFNLRPQLFVWSLILALFSSWGAYKSFSGILSDAKVKGWEYTMCSLNYYNEPPGPNNCPLWAFLFMFSKLPELGDTIFIVLRKQRLIFLHWYHHITVFVYCWYSYGYPVGTGRWFSAINYMVHAIMYSYYVIRASGKRTPKFIPLFITTVQLLQMVAGLYINIYALKMLNQGESCSVGTTNIFFSLLMYFSYLVLFANFFINTYLRKPKAKVKEEAATSNGAIKKEESNGVIKHEESNGVIKRRKEIMS